MLSGLWVNNEEAQEKDIRTAANVLVVYRLRIVTASFESQIELHLKSELSVQKTKPEIQWILNQTFHYTHCITPKRVTSWRGPSPPHCVRITQLLSTKYRSGSESLVTLFDLTDPRFELRTSGSRDERVTARSTGRYNAFQTYQKAFYYFKQGYPIPFINGTIIRQITYIKHISTYPCFALRNNSIDVFICDFTFLRSEHMVCTVTDHIQHLILA